jgi:hypothetical protein
MAAIVMARVSLSVADSPLMIPCADAKGKAMPDHDPIPSRRQADYERAAEAWARYKTMMKWMVLAAVITVGLSLLYLWRSGGPMPLHLVVATIAGVGLTMLVGTGLMGLVFLSNRSGHDEDAAGGGRDDER